MTLELTVPKMACNACSNNITKAVQSLDPHAKVKADPKTKLVLVETQASPNEVKNAIAEAGYPAA